MSDPQTAQILGDIRQQLGDIQGTQRQILAGMASHAADDTRLFQAAEEKRSIDSKRIGSLERSRAGLWAAVITAKAFLAGLAYVIFK